MTNLFRKRKKQVIGLLSDKWNEDWRNVEREKEEEVW